MVQSPHLCSRCGKRLDARAIRAAGRQFHRDCFVCQACQKPLAQTFVPRGERLYHPECHERLFAIRCTHCQQLVEGAYQKDVTGRYHPACFRERYQLTCALCQQALEQEWLEDGWGQKAHRHHLEGPTGQCHVCARLMLPLVAAGGRVLSDGRLLCSGCHRDEVRDFKQIQACKLAVIAQMQAVGFDYIPDYIQIQLSEDQQLLNQRLRASPTGNIHGYTRTAQRMIPGYGLILEHSIHVLSGLPVVAFMGVVAHELLHVWIHERGLTHLSHAQVEGFCNLGTALICTQAHQQGSELARVLLERMETDPDLAYGEGYRIMAWHLQQLGWPALLALLTDPERRLPDHPAQIGPVAVSVAETAPAVARPPVSERAAQKLAEARARLANQRPQGASVRSAVEPVARPEVSPEVAEKVRQKFAAPSTPPSAGGGKLGRLKKPGRH